MSPDGVLWACCSLGLVSDDLVDKRSTPIDTLSNYLAKRLAYGQCGAPCVSLCVSECRCVCLWHMCYTTCLCVCQSVGWCADGQCGTALDSVCVGV